MPTTLAGDPATMVRGATSFSTSDPAATCRAGAGLYRPGACREGFHWQSACCTGESPLLPRPVAKRACAPLLMAMLPSMVAHAPMSTLSCTLGWRSPVSLPVPDRSTLQDCTQADAPCTDVGDDETQSRPHDLQLVGRQIRGIAHTSQCDILHDGHIVANHSRFTCDRAPHMLVA